jgi:putative ABC transport system permease protein
MKPPKNALRFLRWFCREDYVEEIEGDLVEIFEKQFEHSPGKATRKFYWSVIKYFRPEFLKSFTSNYHANPLGMFRHNFLITYRNFLRYKSSFFINLIGLSSGLACTLLIYLWVSDELYFDKFHEKTHRLYQVLTNHSTGSRGIDTSENCSDLLAPALVDELTEVEHVVQVADMGSPEILKAGEKSIKVKGMLVGVDFFNVFTYQLLQGDKEQALANKYDIVISDALAIKLFGTAENVLGKEILSEDVNYSGTFLVSGVFRARANSSMNFDYLLTNALFLDRRPPDYIGWHSNGVKVYITLKEETDVNLFQGKINKLFRTKIEPLVGKEWIGDMFVEQYSDRYLYDRWENGVRAGGRIDYVILFSIIASFVLAIACINFMNLSTARASRRSKEVGVKKSIGVMRRTLIFQYISESTLLTSISLILAVALLFLLLPQFNLITGKQLIVSFDNKFILGVLLITLATGIISGSYPALYLSGFRPVEVLKGKLNTSLGEIWARKGLVIFQFCISILLIVSVMVVYQQIHFIQSKNLGYEKENVLTFAIQGNLNKNLELFIAAAKNTTSVINASYIQGNVTEFSNFSGGPSWEGQQQDDRKIEFTHAHVGYDFIETMGIEMKEGRSFSRKFANEESKIIFNEAAIKVMGLSNPIGKRVDFRGPDREIIGVVKNFHVQSLYEEIMPMALLCKTEHVSTVIVKIQPGTEQETTARLEKVYHTFNPGIPFDFRFLDDEYQALYVAEQRVASLSKYFAVIAIVISCLGLFGLAAFTAERRTKEIGIRKILGCSELRIIRMLSVDFTRMVVIAIIIALPVSYFVAKYWLEGFAYRVELEWWFFIGAGLVALLIAWFTVGMQTIKAARINPSQCLKEE